MHQCKSRADFPSFWGLITLAPVNLALAAGKDTERGAGLRVFIARGAVWNLRPEDESVYPNIERLVELCTHLCDRVREGLIAGPRPPQEEQALYVDLIFFLLYNRHQPSFGAHITRSLERGSASGKLDFWNEFQRDADHYLTNVEAIPAASTPISQLRSFRPKRTAMVYTPTP